MELTSWKLVGTSSLYFKEWNDVAIVYHDISGATHQINALGIEVLKLLQQRACTFDYMIQEMDKTFEVEDEAFLHQQLKQLINEFDNLGLIESCENKRN